MKIKKGDTVKVISGKDKGTSGTVIRAFPKTDHILVEGINVVKRHKRGMRGGEKGAIIEKPMPIHVSNVTKTT